MKIYSVNKKKNPPSSRAATVASCPTLHCRFLLWPQLPSLLQSDPGEREGRGGAPPTTAAPKLLPPPDLGGRKGEEEDGRRSTSSKMVPPPPPVGDAAPIATPWSRLHRCRLLLLLDGAAAYSSSSTEPPPTPTPLLIDETPSHTAPPRSCRLRPLLLIGAAAHITPSPRSHHRHGRWSDPQPPPSCSSSKPPMRDVARVRERENGDGNEWWRG